MSMIPGDPGDVWSWTNDASVSAGYTKQRKVRRRHGYRRARLHFATVIIACAIIAWELLR